MKRSIGAGLWLLAVLLGGMAGLPVRAEESSAATETVRSIADQETEPLTQSDLDPPATTLEEWRVQIAQSLVQVTGVQVNATDAGLELVLQTADGSLVVPETRSVGNALIADIPNAAIAENFEQANPAEGIALVSVTDCREIGCGWQLRGRMRRRLLR